MGLLPVSRSNIVSFIKFLRFIFNDVIDIVEACTFLEVLRGDQFVSWFRRADKI